MPHICDHRVEVGQPDQLRLNKDLSACSFWIQSTTWLQSHTELWSVFVQAEKMILCVVESKTLQSKSTHPDGGSINMTGMQTAADHHHHLPMALICERNQSKWKCATVKLKRLILNNSRKFDTSSQFIYWINLDKHQNLLRYNQNIWGRYPTMHHPVHKTND